MIGLRVYLPYRLVNDHVALVVLISIIRELVSLVATGPAEPRPHIIAWDHAVGRGLEVPREPDILRFITGDEFVGHHVVYH